MTEQRFKPLSDAEMTPEQRRLAQAIASGPRGGLRGPFQALLRAPELGDLVQRVGAQVRYKNVLPAPLKELAILVTARHWTAQYEWYAHRSFAIEAGLKPALCDAIAAGRRPETMAADEAIVYGFATELLATQGVSDATFAAVKDRFGERAVVELICTLGYYSTVAMILNVDRHPLPEGVAPMPHLSR
ncbi:MAG TPA: carboxymuconolactone decarboxylase family protein [Stellaceae bacterium]|nr:carboxymuconolactone decarboxylase family protein [Stellaceae bacterium]